jgi:hypothetical protein
MMTGEWPSDGMKAAKITAPTAYVTLHAMS